MEGGLWASAMVDGAAERVNAQPGATQRSHSAMQSHSDVVLSIARRANCHASRAGATLRRRVFGYAQD